MQGTSWHLPRASAAIRPHSPAEQGVFALIAKQTRSADPSHRSWTGMEICSTQKHDEVGWTAPTSRPRSRQTDDRGHPLAADPDSDERPSDHHQLG